MGFKPSWALLGVKALPKMRLSHTSYPVISTADVTVDLLPTDRREHLLDLFRA